MATKKAVNKPSSSKKEYKKSIAVKIETALQDLKIKLGDKEFQHRIKKAAKMLSQGLHNKSMVASNNNNVSIEKTVKKVKTAKKIKAKKQAPAAAK